MSTTLEQRIARLEAREEILALCHTYARAQDRLDHAAHRSVFHDDAWLDYGYFKGGPDEFVDFAQGALRGIGITQHFLGQIEIDITSETEAFGEVYLIAHHQVDGPDGRLDDWIYAGRYVDRYERRDGVWKIAYRAEIADWIKPAAPGAVVTDLMGTAILARKDGADLSQRRAEFRRPG